jgi:hypothetical protein
MKSILGDVCFSKFKISNSTTIKQFAQINIDWHRRCTHRAHKKSPSKFATALNKRHFSCRILVDSGICATISDREDIRDHFHKAIICLRITLSGLTDRTVYIMHDRTQQSCARSRVCGIYVGHIRPRVLFTFPLCGRHSCRLDFL